MSTQGTLLNTDYTVGGGEVNVQDITAPAKATYTYYFNGENMQAGDEITLRVFMQAIDADTPQIISLGDLTFTEVTGEEMISSFPVVIEQGQTFKLTFEQTAGTARDWTYRVADVPI